jgi:hypothetical protein
MISFQENIQYDPFHFALMIHARSLIDSSSQLWGEQEDVLFSVRIKLAFGMSAITLIGSGIKLCLPRCPFLLS